MGRWQRSWTGSSGSNPARSGGSLHPPWAVSAHVDHARGGPDLPTSGPHRSADLAMAPAALRPSVAAMTDQTSVPEDEGSVDPMWRSWDVRAKAGWAEFRGGPAARNRAGPRSRPGTHSAGAAR